MGGPKRVIYEHFHLYDKLHTERVKMYSGVEMTVLYPIKETDTEYRSIESWAYCASTFRRKKKNLVLNVEIPVLKDEKTVNFLKKNAWYDWVDKQTECNDTDIIEAVRLLDNLFPDKKKVYFSELRNLLSSYNHGTFVRYDANGNITPPTEHDIEHQKYYNRTYNRFIDVDVVNAARLKWTSEKDEKLKDQYLSEYLDFEAEYAFENKDLNLINSFVELGKHAVCYPVAFSKRTGQWGIEEHGREMSYAKAGEIEFVVTEDEVFFGIERHY